MYTRTGRSFFPDTSGLVDTLRNAVATLFEELDSAWLALDCELLPWSAKAMGLIQDQYASVGAAAGGRYLLRLRFSRRRAVAASTSWSWLTA